MGSTLRNDTRRALFLERLAKSWDKRGDLSFGELLAASLPPPVLSHIVQLDDVAIAEAVERFVLLGGADTDPPKDGGA